jgi:hypothetical protein
MSNPNNTENKKSNSWDKFITYVIPFLGVVSTALSILITITTLSINQRINNLQSSNLELDAKLKRIDLQSKESEARNSQLNNSVRLEAEFRIFNANAFARNYKEKGMQIIWLDKNIQNDIENWTGDWINGNKLMTGSSSNGLFARQVVCLRVVNAGNTPARKINLVVKKAKVDNGKGKLRRPYYEADTKDLTWTEKAIDIGDLAESSKGELLKTQILIPLAHVSGSDKYFGEIILPLKLSWNDERQNHNGKMIIDIKGNIALKSDLESSVLGRSNF